ncbi:oligosaccharide flippase family protein [Micromonospora soli]|uniref:lipopolysaccharide biosynthesis protein n=1 Tax=Micromonospora sp. NBRC 110009 TaxID=3061627 RepID=UPI00267247BE|nr:oligosaccharide flippase family protein [Micromonospora sp. NBRC 110009]WKT99079.1 oligosaccharide flippase family protein [Micromonospora sp. NBRC 110009]
MARNRTRAVAMLTGASALTAAANSAGAMAATVALGADERGAMVLVLTISGVVAMIAPLGTGIALRAQLPRVDDEAARGSLLGSYLWLTLGLAALGAALAVVAVRVSAPAIDAGLADPRLLVAVAVSTLAQVLLWQSNELFYAVAEFRQGATWNLASVVAGLAGLLVAIAISAQAWLLLLLQGTGVLAAMVARLRPLRRRGLIRPVAPSGQVLRALFRQGVPSLGLNIGIVLAQRADRYILGVVAGTTAVGIYSLGATMSGMAGLIPLAIGQVSLNDAATAGARFWPGRHIVWALGGATLSSIAIALGGWLLLVPVFGEDFAPARHLLFPLLVAEICLAPYWVAGRALLGGGWSRTAAVIGAASAVGAAALYGFAIPIWGMTGAALASIALYAGLSLMSMALLARRVGGPRGRIPATAARHAPVERVRIHS